MQRKINLNQKIVLPDTVYATEVDGEMVLLDMTSENYFGLDSVGTDIWRLLKDGNTLLETQNTLLEMYDVDQDLLVRDFWGFIEKLEKNGLVKIG